MKYGLAGKPSAVPSSVLDTVSCVRRSPVTAKNHRRICPIIIEPFRHPAAPGPPVIGLSGDLKPRGAG
eukprot:319684-Hanusia_phi.AAC.1